MDKRKANVRRTTKETDVTVTVDLGRAKPVSISTTVPFFDHMLDLFACHAGIRLAVKAKGDTHIDDHHLVEDTGITLGLALKKALGSKAGINRYGNFLLPMDEALSYVALDLSGRPHLEYRVPFSCRKTGFDFDLVQEFFRALSVHAGITLHISLEKGRNNHHIAESVFKGFGRALAQAIAVGSRRRGIPSTKGKL